MVNSNILFSDQNFRSDQLPELINTLGSLKAPLFLNFLAWVHFPFCTVWSHGSIILTPFHQHLTLTFQYLSTHITKSFQSYTDPTLHMKSPKKLQKICGMYWYSILVYNFSRPSRAMLSLNFYQFLPSSLPSTISPAFLPAPLLMGSPLLTLLHPR